MCLVCENSTLSVNNQCDVVVYGLSGSRSPHSVSPVEESTITPHVLGLWEFHSLCKKSMWCGCLQIEWIKVSTRCQSCRRIYNYSTYDNVAYKLQNIYWQANKSMWCFCNLQYRDSLILSSSAHKPDMQRDTQVSIDLVRRNGCNSILYKEFKKAYHGSISFQMLTMTLYSYWNSPFVNDNNHFTQHFLTKKQVRVNMARGGSRKSRKGERGEWDVWQSSWFYDIFFSTFFMYVLSKG